MALQRTRRPSLRSGRSLRSLGSPLNAYPFGPTQMTDGNGMLQRRMAKRYATDFVEAPPDSKIGIAQNARPGQWPLNGFRHRPEGDTCGWYIWAGETLSPEPDFFEPHHVSHVPALLPSVVPYLGLPPGWRFLLAEEHEDVWYDPKLLPG